MAKFILTNVRTLVGGYDISGDVNTATVTANRQQKDVTNYNSAGWTESIAGLGVAKVNLAGFYEAGAGGFSDDALTIGAAFANPGGITLAPSGATDGALVYLTNAYEFDYNPLDGKVGDVAPFKADLTSTWPLVRGVIALPSSTVITTTGTGTINTLTGPILGQQLYADLHIISVSGSPTITFTVQSAAAIGFASPTTRISFVAATGIGGQILRVPGPVTDGFWRAQWTVGGTGSVLATMAFGVA